MYWTVKARRTRENNDNELIHLGNLFKQIGKHLTTIRITGRITRKITGPITRPITRWITKCKRKDVFLWKVGSFLKGNDAKEKKGGRMLFFFKKLEQMYRLGSRDRHSRWWSKTNSFHIWDMILRNLKILLFSNYRALLMLLTPSPKVCFHSSNQWDESMKNASVSCQKSWCRDSVKNTPQTHNYPRRRPRNKKVEGARRLPSISPVK